MQNYFIPALCWKFIPLDFSRVAFLSSYQSKTGLKHFSEKPYSLKGCCLKMSSPKLVHTGFCIVDTRTPAYLTSLVLHPQTPGLPSGGTEENRPSFQWPNYLFAFSCTAHESPFTHSGKDDGADKRSLFPSICFRKAGALSAKWPSTGLISYYRRFQLPCLSCQSPGIRLNI